MRGRTITTADGTRLKAWTNDGAGVPVVISNGLGTPHSAWPTVTKDSSRYRAVTWDHRGLGGSDRPADEGRIAVQNHADDLLAVMDTFEIDRAVVIGWSVGVNIAFEVAQREPARVAAVLAVAGVPGGSFSALFHPMPQPLRPRAGWVGAHLLRFVGPVLTRLADGLPASPEGGFEVRGLAAVGLDLMHAATFVHVVREFAHQDWPWYSRLVRALGEHKPIDLSFVDIPVTFLAGKWDPVASAEQVRQASDLIRGSRFVEIAGSHFLPLQFPGVMNSELDRLIERSDLEHSSSAG